MVFPLLLQKKFLEPLVLISVVAFIASLLTFFSGFGLGTILTPFFAIFFTVEKAIALTAIVHFLNNIFKIFLIGKNIDYKVLLKFGLPAIVGAFAGARLLLFLPQMPAIYEYDLFGKIHEITPINLIVSFLLIIFSILEIIPELNKVSFADKLIAGGILSGFFGGLSGNQGALRSMFLIKLNLSKESFIATGIAIAVLVDISRLSVYFFNFREMEFTENFHFVAAAILSAFTGALLGRKLLKKVTFKFVRLLVSIAIIFLAIGLGAGLL